MTAIFSHCRNYRYMLIRNWSAGTRSMAFIGLNPSTADETKDDPTIRRCMGFAKAWGYDTMFMVNLFAFRATNPKAMLDAADPIGPENDHALQRVCSSVELVVAAWGVHGVHKARDAVVSLMIPNLQCLGTTKAGHPRHPLYIRKDAKPVPFTYNPCAE